MSKEKWFKKSYRRVLIDMHIDDWNEKFLTEFDPEKYVKLLKISDIQTILIQTVSHTGLCYWPSRNGQIHKGLKGKDLLGELIDLFKREGLDVILYYSTIFNNWAYEKYPSWRMVNIDGDSTRDLTRIVPVDSMQMARYGTCCPNSEDYKKFTINQINEITANYDFEGMWMDMPFWAMVCYCESCKERYMKECNSEIPEIIDWNDPEWLSFQKKREDWMYGYEKMIGDAIKKKKPEATITYNIATATNDWIFGVSEKTGTMPDYCSGDRFGGFGDQLFACKLYRNISRNLPFEFITSVCEPSLMNDHVTIKSKNILKLHAYISLAHNGAFLFVDAIDPIGTTNPRRYKIMGEIFNETKKYESYLGGNMLEDIVIYYSFDSKMNNGEDGNRPEMDFTQHRPSGDPNYPHLDAAFKSSIILRKENIPFGIISRKHINNLEDYKVLVLPNVVNLEEGETNQIINYVENGGNLYISGKTSQKLLGTLFGVKYNTFTKEKTTYISPSGENNDLLYDTTVQSPLYAGPQAIIESRVQGQVLGKTVLPYTDPGDQTTFASIHSNTPGKWIDNPSIIYNEFGKGKAIWTSFPIETINKDPHRKTFINLIKKMYAGKFTFESNAPEPVEITAFLQENNNRYVINCVNAQENIETPIPIFNFKIELIIGVKQVKKIKSITYGEELIFVKNKDSIEIEIPKLEVFNMIIVEYV